MEILTIDEIKAQYPDEWVLLSLANSDILARPDKGTVLLHSKDYLELCYKASEIAKNIVTTIFLLANQAKTVNGQNLHFYESNRRRFNYRNDADFITPQSPQKKHSVSKNNFHSIFVC